MVGFIKYWNYWFQECVKSCNIAHARACFKLNVGRQGFGSVNPEIQIIEGQIIELLLYFQINISFTYIYFQINVFFICITLLLLDTIHY